MAPNGGYERIGVEQPVLDEHGTRPKYDDDGNLRGTELVPWPAFSEIEFAFNELASVADRRWIDAVLDNFAGKRESSLTYAADYEVMLRAALARFVKSIRIGDQEIKGEQAVRGIVETAEYEDGIVLLNWLHRKARLESAKKKNWKQQFGLGT